LIEYHYSPLFHSNFTSVDGEGCEGSQEDRQFNITIAELVSWLADGLLLFSLLAEAYISH
jgi:hypothetical protein